MLVEAAWVISSAPGPLRAFFIRIGDKRGKHVAAVATAPKPAVIIWHILSKDEDYTWNRPALLQWKLRKLELKAGHPSRRGGRQKGSAAAYSNKSVRDSERETIANCRGRIPPLHRDLETAIAKGALGRHKEGATIIGCAIGLEPRPCSLPRGRPSRHSVTQSQSSFIPLDANDSVVLAPS